MNYKWLKWTRVAIALVFFFLISLIFLDFRDVVNEKGVRSITFLQFVPSLLKFLTALSLAGIGFLLIVLLTALFGRVYCSTICPLGVLQDFMSRVGMRFKKRKKYKFRKSNNVLRYSILFISVLVSVFLSILLVNLLDPYSLYGKVANQLFRPAGIWINNGIAGILEGMNIYFLYRKDQHPISFPIFFFSVFIFGLLIVMAGKYGRLYCNTICPVGSLLGLFSRSSLLRIHMNPSSCTQCGKCSVVCKAECISVKNISVDHSRCVSCFNCLTVCEDSAIDYGLKKKAGIIEASSDKGRKSFFLTTLAGIFSLTGFKRLYASIPPDTEPLNKKPTTVPLDRNYFVSPPGSLGIGHFTSVCTACQLCVSQCPTGVLQASKNQFGLSSIMQPFMDYNTNYCNYDCVRCSEVCPTGAILPLAEEKKKTLQLGKVQFIKENCVVYTENTACGSCSEHCPTQAVRMVPYEGSLTIPETDNSICVGCGACEYACPVVPYKAIFVDGHSVHETAKKPEQEELIEPSSEEDFPF
jgi:ferredoxin